MKEITIANEFACTVDETKLDDMELFEEIVKLDKGDVTGLPAIVSKLLGDEQKKALYENIRAKDGRVTITATVTAVKDIFSALDSGKK